MKRSTGESEFEKELLALRPFLRAFTRRLVGGNREDAEDLAQEALTKAWGARETYTVGTNLKAWVFTIARNQLYSERRQAWRRVALEEGHFASLATSPAEGEEVMEAKQTINICLPQLPQEQQQAVLALGWLGESYKEAAVRLDCPVGTVKSRVARGRQHLKEIAAHQSR